MVAPLWVVFSTYPIMCLVLLLLLINECVFHEQFLVSFLVSNIQTKYIV